MADTKPESNTYSLKQIESQLLSIIHNNQQAIFSAVLSTIASDRLAYKVTERTQFKLSPDLDSVEITELPEAEVPTAKAPETPVEEPKTGAVAAK